MDHCVINSFHISLVLYSRPIELTIPIDIHTLITFLEWDPQLMSSMRRTDSHRNKHGRGAQCHLVASQTRSRARLTSSHATHKFWQFLLTSVTDMSWLCMSGWTSMSQSASPGQNNWSRSADRRFKTLIKYNGKALHIVHAKWVPVTTAWSAGGRDGLQIWRVAANILNKQ
jgi:hypothetical protein